MSYLFVLGGVIAGAFVLVVAVVSDALLHPVTKAPITSPNNTISVYVLFIGWGYLLPIQKKGKHNFMAFFVISRRIRK
jgi:hypothetical protein